MLYFLSVASTYLTITTSILMGFLTIIRNPKSKISILWFSATLVVFLWAFFHLNVHYAVNVQSAFDSIRLIYSTAIFIPVFYFHFTLSLMYLEKKFFPLLLLIYVVGFVFSLISYFSDFVVSGARVLDGFGYHELINLQGFMFYVLFFSILVLSSLFLQLRLAINSDGVRRKKIFFIFAAGLIGFSGGMTHFVADLTGIFPYGHFVVWLYPLLVTYGIFVDEIKIKVRV